VPSKPLNVMILAGEASGDLHGARMVQALGKLNPNFRFRGMGGDQLRDQGVEILFDCKSISVIGLFEVLTHWPEIKRALRTIENAIVNTPPDLLVLIDYVEFNLRMAAVAKRVGVKVLFYVSPQIWAWRPERISKIGALVDTMAVIFPFEVKFYQAAGIPVRYVGHPLSGNVKSDYSREQFCRENDIPAGKKIVGLLPGSRINEIRHILPVLLDTARCLNRDRDDIVFVLPIAPTLSREKLETRVANSGVDNLKLLDGRAYDVMNCADSIAIASGTATLEAAIIGVPMAIVYKVSGLSWFWLRRKLQISHVGLVNIVAEREIVPEFIQANCRAELLAPEISRQLDDKCYRRAMQLAQSGVKSMLGNRDAAREVAELAVEMLSE
jgi:lipid-A-disaccharide synthase